MSQAAAIRSSSCEPSVASTRFAIAALFSSGAKSNGIFLYKHTAARPAQDINQVRRHQRLVSGESSSVSLVDGRFVAGGACPLPISPGRVVVCRGGPQVEGR